MKNHCTTCLLYIMNKINYLLISILVILFTACSSSPSTEIPEEIAELENLTVIPADAEPVSSIDFNRKTVYGDTEDVMVGSIFGVAVDISGRVFIADGDQNYIHAYNPDGTYLRKIASEGEGPGEFSGISQLKADEEYLYSHDRSKRRVNVFQLETLEFSRTIPLLQDDHDIEALEGAYPSTYHLRNDGTLLVSYSQPFFMNSDSEDDEERMILYYQLDRDGNVVSDKIFEQRSADTIVERTDSYMTVTTPPYGRRSLLSIAEDDRLISAWTEDFLVKVHNPDGSYDRAIYYPYSKSELDINEILEDRDDQRSRRMIRNDDSPDTWQALNSLTVDDESRLWISTITDDQDTYDWWVISEEGELLTRFTWPRSRNLQEVKTGTVYTEETDEETGLQQIVRYSFELS